MLALTKRIIVAIDGPAGAGKSTLAKRVAARLSFIYIDTGAMYRAVALWARRTGVEWTDHHRLEQLAQQADIRLERDGRVLLNGEDVSAGIREPEISQGASVVSAVSGVRRALVAKQQEMGEIHSAVMEGRDIGTVVFPHAEVKVFLDATPEVRAQRRVADLQARGLPADFEEVLREMKQRDDRDSTRPDSPLRQAPDATYLDSSHMDANQVEEALLRIVRERTSNGKEAHR
ncbi:(d)CMP kinase [uncultured Paludibaculum sp.]|uniref:(d)CMP kinase n=1 Tax=uncultured Paludibaculum sp. TaxID=1765020 RepID=UPI002AABBFF5|nr:(d)CMP kinase [uncultured Paludibaculum sp.]